MQVSIIGSGNVATVLAKQLYSKGYIIKEVFSHTFSHAAALAAAVHAKAVDSLAGLSRDADAYIIAVSDRAIEGIVEQLQLGDKLLLHTAGSVPKNVLQHASKSYGVLYPVQSIRKNMDAQTPIPFMVDGNDEATTIEIENLASTLNPKVVRGGDEQRVKLHVAAVFACNFVNYMYLQSARFCEAENIDFSLLQSLIEETALRLRDNHPKDVFTGPAVRKDIGTVNKHLNILESHPGLQEMYGMISKKIMEN